MTDWMAPASVSIIAFVTTVHAALLVTHVQHVAGLRRLLAAGPACAFAGLAWVLSSPLWLGAGLAVHGAWLAMDLRGASSVAPVPVQHAAHPTTATPPRTVPSFTPVTVLAVVRECDSIRTFRVSRPVGFDFVPGQFLMVRVQVDDESIVRCYSISSAPHASGYLEFSVRRQGRASNALHDGVGAGDTLLVHPPLGRFTLPAGDGRLVLVGGGIGITPLMSMLRHTVSVQPDRPVTLLYSFKDRQDAAFLDEIDWLRRRHPQVKTVMTVTGDGAADDGCRRGRIDAEFIAASVPDLEDGVFLVCGPLPMIDAVRAGLAGGGVDESRVRHEAFEAAAAVAASAARTVDTEAGGRLRLAVSSREVDVAPSETLLEAAERAGAPVASFCRAGICGTCRTRLVSGDVRCSAEGLSAEDREHGYVLPCVARPLGDCVLEA